MAHESFEDRDIAKIMNERFINVKVDREERPDLDVIYQSALALMGQTGGWPLTAFLTPEGKPFWGGTYFPPKPLYGRPAFSQVLIGLHNAWISNRDQVVNNVGIIAEALEALSQPRGGKALNMNMVDRVAEGLLRNIDPAFGGFRGAPKFPQIPYLRLLWRTWQRGVSVLYFDAVTTTLEHMAQGGIYDHLGGGFARYATDERWRVPHFEKMLYDNAMVVSLMCEVWKETHFPLLKTRIHETLTWVLREMKIEEGLLFAFVSAQDADTLTAAGQYAEGAFYVWREDEIDDVLGKTSPLFKKTYGVNNDGNWRDGVNILTRLDPYPGEPAVEKALMTARKSLFTRREKRPQPHRDEKVLADLNGLMIQALAEAAMAFDEPAWLAAAETAFAFISNNLTRQGRLSRTWNRSSDGARTQHRAVLDDLAQMSRAALFLFEATGDETYLAQTEAWVRQADDLFWCSHNGGYCLSARDADDLITRPRTSADNALPSGNGTMADVLSRLYLITAEDAYREKARAVIDSFPADDPEAIANMPTLLTAFELLENGAQVVIVGEPNDSAAMIRAALSAPGSLRVVLRVDTSRTLPPQHPAHGRKAVNGLTTAYICHGGTCHRPLTDTHDLIQALKAL